MSRLRLALLNASYDAADARRNFRRELDGDLVEFHAPSGEYPATFDFDAAVVTGSSASVYWDEDWIGDLKRWVGDAIERGMPILGVCYGHQLLADVLGGQVEEMDGYEIGYREVHHNDDSRLFEGIDEEFLVFTTHGDRVSELPPGASLLAENDYGIHAFRKGDVFAVQFHPEYDMETAVSVTEGKDQLSDERIQTVLGGITEGNYGQACEVKLLFENFTQYVREQVQSESESVSGLSHD